jgi:AMMECR1 domain-containing protein
MVLFAAAAGPALSLRAADAPPPPAPPAPPAISPLDQRFLTRCVRRMLEQQIREGRIDPMPYAPPELRDLRCQVLVTLREDGLHRGTGISSLAPLPESCREAVRLALERVAATGTPMEPALANHLVIEMEAIGDPVPLGVNGLELLSGPVERCIEPGVDGLRLTFGATSARLSPSEFVSYNVSTNKAVTNLTQSLGATLDVLDQVEITRFRSTHWVERAPGQDVVFLQRGMVPVSPGAVTAESLAAAMERMAKYIAYRQQPTGRMTAAYDPAEDKYLDEYVTDEFLQAEAARALAAYARRPGRAAAFLSPAAKSIDLLARRVVNLPRKDNAGYVRTPDERNRLGTTALACLAMTEFPEPVRYRFERDKLVGGMIWAQASNGRFVTGFPPADVLATQESYPGQALLALAQVYDEQPQQAIMEVFDRAHGYYRELFETCPSPEFAGWHIQAYARMAMHSKRDDFAAFVFRMADALAAVQLRESNCPWPDKWGGMAPYHPSDVGSATASYLCGLCDALALARHRGDAARIEAYETAVRLGARFLLQIEFKPEEAYYVRSRLDTIGGVRRSLIDSTLRIDACSHALLALMQARDVLYPEAR